MIAYSIYTDNYEGGSDVIAIASSPESRDAMLRELHEYKLIQYQLENARHLARAREIAFQRSFDKSNPKPTPPKHVKNQPTKELIEYRKTQSDKGNVEQANAVQEEIDSIERANRERTENRRIELDTFNDTCNRIESEYQARRDEYLTETEKKLLSTNFPRFDYDFEVEEIVMDVLPLPKIKVI